MRVPTATGNSGAATKTSVLHAHGAQPSRRPVGRFKDQPALCQAVTCFPFSKRVSAASDVCQRSYYIGYPPTI
jgi:hypothetical protein